MPNTKSEILDTIMEKYLEGELDLDHAVALTNKLSMVDGSITEGANIDQLKIIRACKKDFRHNFRELKSAVKLGKSNKSKVEKIYKEIMKNLDTFDEQVDNCPSTMMSSMISLVTSTFLDMVKWLIPMILTLGIAAVVPVAKGFTQIVHGMNKYSGGKENLEDTWNQFKQSNKLAIDTLRGLANQVKRAYDSGKWDGNVKESFNDDDITAAKVFLYESADAGKISDDLLEIMLSRLGEM